jgi:alkylhydroperoxidase family enzyme
LDHVRVVKMRRTTHARPGYLIAQTHGHPGLWEDKDLVLFRLIDQLVLIRKVEDRLTQEMLYPFSEQDIIDIIHIIGFYTGVAMLVAFAQPELDHYKQYAK